MTCAYCRRPIPRRDVAARLYNRSAHTGLHYCLRADCIAVGKRIVELEKKLPMDLPVQP